MALEISLVTDKGIFGTKQKAAMEGGSKEGGNGIRTPARATLLNLIPGSYTLVFLPKAPGRPSPAQKNG